MAVSTGMTRRQRPSAGMPRPCPRSPTRTIHSPRCCSTGRLDESEGELRKALALDEKFAGAWTGIAQTRLLRSDEAGADQALTREIEVDPRPQAKLNSHINVADALRRRTEIGVCRPTVHSGEVSAKRTPPSSRSSPPVYHPR